jgi:hypothetical protein
MIRCPDAKDVVARYIDGFRRNDHAQIMSCLTDDVEDPRQHAAAQKVSRAVLNRRPSG